MSIHFRLGIAAVLVVVAFSMRSGGSPEPAPSPAPSGLSLRGMFVGETAVEDAATLAALCDEIASEIEWDGQQAEPLLKTGVAFDTLRTRARTARMKGGSIGERQPAARDAIASHLDSAVGESGGPVSVEARALWVAAYRNIARACRDAIGQ